MTDNIPPCAPVLLIGFNRPDFMRAQIAAVRAAKPAKLYMVVDGPRDGRPDEAEKCAAVRDCAQLVDWPCEVKTLFREKNLGCKMGVSCAITWLFENEEAGIILEDDCRPSPDFFRFATEMLDRYKDDERIGIIAGFNYYNLQTDKTVSYHFSSHIDIWGWASWRRVWKHYDVEMKALRPTVDNAIQSLPMRSFHKKMFRNFVREIDAGLNTWDIQFVLLCLSNHWLSIVPAVRLVSNLGMADANATHTGGYCCHAHEWEQSGTIQFPLAHPASIVCDADADRLQEKMDCAIFPRALTWIGCKLPSLTSSLDATMRIARRVLPFLFRL